MCEDIDYCLWHEVDLINQTDWGIARVNAAFLTTWYQKHISISTTAISNTPSMTCHFESRVSSDPRSLLRCFFTPLDVWCASNRTLETDVWTPRNGVKRPRPIDLGRSLGRPTVCLPETKWVPCPTHQPIKWSSTEYLAMFTRSRSHTRIIGKRN